MHTAFFLVDTQDITIFLILKGEDDTGSREYSQRTATSFLKKSLAGEKRKQARIHITLFSLLLLSSLKSNKIFDPRRRSRESCRDFTILLFFSFSCQLNNLLQHSSTQPFFLLWKRIQYTKKEKKLSLLLRFARSPEEKKYTQLFFFFFFSWSGFFLARLPAKQGITCLVFPGISSLLKYMGKKYYKTNTHF